MIIHVIVIRERKKCRQLEILDDPIFSQAYILRISGKKQPPDEGGNAREGVRVMLYEQKSPKKSTAH